MKWAERFKQFFLKNEQEYLLMLKMAKKTGTPSDPFPGTANLYHGAEVTSAPPAKPVLVK